MAAADKYIRHELADDRGGHDYLHVLRVVKLTRKIQKHEKGDLFVTLLAAYLHDLDDPKVAIEGISRVDSFLDNAKVEPDIIKRVKSIVENISYTKEMAGNELTDIEGKIVRDADRLDAIGAIGIARCFAYGGYRNRPIYSGNINDQSSVTHFYDKLLNVKNLMLTVTGKRLAKKRHRRMSCFLSWFHQEWNESA